MTSGGLDFDTFMKALVKVRPEKPKRKKKTKSRKAKA